MDRGKLNHLPPPLRLAVLSPELSLATLTGDPRLQAVARLAGSQGQRLWLCGGTLRDLLLGLTPPDLDLAASGDALDLGRRLARELGGTFVPLGERFAVCRLVLPQGPVDLGALRAESIEADLAARDFTVNALAVEVEPWLAGEARILDPTGGESDLAARLLRPAGPGVLAADPLRVLRGFRFLASHLLRPAPGVLKRLAAAGPGLAKVAKERIGQEMLKLMAGARAGEALKAMDQAGVLLILVPELAPARGMVQNPYHHLDVLAHSLATVTGLKEILADLNAWLGPLAGEAGDYLAAPKALPRLKMACLLHDLGKPPTRQEQGPQTATFYRHDTVGASLARRRIMAWGLSREDADTVARLVGQHMRPLHLLGAQSRGRLSRRAVRRLNAALGPDLPGLFLLALADARAGQGPARPPDVEERLKGLYLRVAKRRDQDLAAAAAAPPLMDGHRLMAGLAIGPGPEVGRLLELLREAQLDGEINDSKQALDLARRLHRQVSAAG